MLCHFVRGPAVRLWTHCALLQMAEHTTAVPLHKQRPVWHLCSCHCVCRFRSFFNCPALVAVLIAEIAMHYHNSGCMRSCAVQQQKPPFL
ncbi:hypothetical protein COO60DRAFT_716543 [Scenedesmus sp. NREL 46B-D3]|nr:hypothetical protein COO60DRAFT_716543 [Scenedesmus sp. NREL 46B-D3]